MTQKISSSNIETATLASFSGPTIANVSIANSTYTILDDTAVSNAGGYVVITGSNFQSGAQVLFGSTSATSVTFVDSTQLNVQVPALTAGSYVVYVQNGDGSTAVRLNGITSSPIPVWSTGSTLTEQGSGTPISISLSATSDSNVTYSVANGSSLPSGTTLAANGLFSGTVTVENDTTYNFSVNAIDIENQETLRAFSVTVGVSDSYYYLTTLHLVDNGTNNANNNVFNDSSNNNFAITRNGNTTQGTFSPFSQTGWSNYFDGSGDYLSINNNDALKPGTGDFTIEFWGYLRNQDGAITSGGSSSLNVQVRSGSLELQLQGVSFSATSSLTGYFNIWTHFAFSRNSGVTRLFFNGILVNSVTESNNYQGSDGTFNIGYRADANFFINGHISNLRLVKGTGLYTSNFTPSTIPLTAVSGTSLLTCQSNRFRDNSTNNFTLTRNGDTSVLPFSPFAPTAAYSAVTVGGSGYFDGNGDYLTLPSNTAFSFGTGDFTVEAWVYLTATGSFGVIFVSSTTGTGNSLHIQVNNTNRIRVTNESAEFLLATNAITLNTWTHIAVVRTGTSLRIYQDGTLNGSTTNSTSFTENAPMIGYEPVGGNYYFTGYISNLRVVKGTAVYTADFTPPTAPLTAITNTSLLTNFTNAGITDATSKNVLETVGNAQVSTVQSKFGGSSILFDGAGDYLYVPSSINYGYGTGNFTIEFWLYLNSTGLQTIVSHLSSNPQVKPHIYYSGGVRLYVNGADVITGGTVTISTWTHIALSRSATSTKLFINGTQSGSTYTDSNNYGTSSPLIIGDYGVPATGSNMLNGYIDDLRITKFARYTANFTAPTSAFKTR